MNYRNLIAVVLMAWISAMGSVASAQKSFVDGPSWKIPSVEEAGQAFETWVHSTKASEAVQQQAIDYWNSTEMQDESDLLTRTVKAMAVIEPRVTELLSTCDKFSGHYRLPAFDWFDDAEAGPFFSNNTRLFYGRWLAQEKYYDECLMQIENLKAEETIDPAALLFYKAAALHGLVKVEPSMETIKILMQREAELPERYRQVAALMQKDLTGVKEETLDHVARQMEDVQRRLDMGRATDKTIDVELEVLSQLDKIIEKLEEQQKKQQVGGQGNQPMQDSQRATQKGPGNVTPRDIGHKADWGDLSEKDREKAMQDVAREFPPQHREVIEAYFKKIAEEEANQKP